jgi:hypothetical protein
MLNNDTLLEGEGTNQMEAILLASPALIDKPLEPSQLPQKVPLQLCLI